MGNKEPQEVLTRHTYSKITNKKLGNTGDAVGYSEDDVIGTL